MNYLEMVGYFASLLVLISLLMTSVVKLRVINMIGSLIFAIYALCIVSYPTAIMNFCLVGVNIFYLVRMAKTEKYFTMLPSELDSPYFRYFLQFHQQDIGVYFPDFNLEDTQADVAFFVYCDTTAAGILIGRELGDGALEVALDYTTPQYRDCSVGRYLYEQLAQKGYRKLVAGQASEKHGAYLEKMGFSVEDGHYTKYLENNQTVE